ncbi:hypothetical protein HPB48_002194 [Haemaphysalis longicornis]|uniref:Uncharacterized protein n=1 Tax=Haemaphysalis longicornis TaxID=44386 RepID=A0A9J6FIF3_HAELO|nr:hypothetical protein HPB48_002194 [Haemaphysalis longicornis]
MLACEASPLRHAAQDPQVQHRLLDTTRIANAFVDEMLRIFRLNTVLMERLTPLRIPGELRFPGGRVHDVRVMKLPALERRGDVSASLEAGVFAVSGGLGLDELLVQSRYSVGPREPFQVAGDIDSRIRNTTARVQLAIDVARARAVMDVFKVCARAVPLSSTVPHPCPQSAALTSAECLFMLSRRRLTVRLGFLNIRGLCACVSVPASLMRRS